MEEQTQSVQENNNDINENNLIYKIWTKPKATMQYVVDYCPTKYVFLFLALGGIVNSIDRASTKSMGDNASTLEILAIAIIAGGLFGWISAYIFAWAMSGTGKWLKGEATPANFRTIIAWSSVPVISSMVLIIPQVFIFGDELFKSQPIIEYDVEIYLWYIFTGIELVLAIWSVVLLVKGIALIQNFKIGKSILNMFLPGLIFIGAIIAIVFLFKLF